MVKIVKDIFEQKASEGRAFGISYFPTDIANNTTRYLRIKTNSKEANLVLDISASANCEFKSYEGTTYTADGTEPDGIVLTYFNRKLIDKVAKTQVYHTPTIDDLGKLRMVKFVPGGEKAQTTGGSVATNLKTVVPPESDLLISVTSLAGSGATADIVINMDWYEEEPEYRYSIPTLTLSELTVEDIEETALTLVPTFDSDVKVYAIDEVDYLTRKVVIAAEPQEDEEFAIIRGLGVIDLDVGENVLNVGIIYPEFNGSNYQISIPREDGALLSALSAVYEVTIEEEPVEIELIEDFDPDIFEYEATVANEIDEIDVTATPLDEATTVLIDGEPSPETILLTEGLNEIDVVCTLADHTTLTYSIKITREEAE